VQQELFNSLLLPENRRVEPYASALLSLLNHPTREPLSNRYILPALEILEEIQRTGDIFFPLDWCQSLLSGHHSREASQQVKQFETTHPDLPEPLLNKLRQAAYRLKNH
jgi:aminopeptidase N